MQDEAPASPPEALPLAGIKVVEFAHTIMGPFCGLVLADLGAEVIKVEPAPSGDRTRRLHGFGAGFFPAFNRNKLSVAVDLKQPAGLKIAKDLVAAADVVVENFAPDTMDRLGLGYGVLRERNPGLVYCSLKGFLSGPMEHRLALDEVVQHMSGLAYMTGLPGRPMRTGASVVDILGGLFGAVGVLAALRERETTGRGQLVRSALFEAACCLMTQHLAGEAVTGEKRLPLGSGKGSWAVYRSFPTADGRSIFLAITSDQHWRRFCQAFRQDHLLDDPDLQTNEARVVARDSFIPIIEKIFAGSTLEQLSETLDLASLPFSPTNTPGDLVDHPQVNANGRMQRVRMPDGSFAGLPSLPLEVGEHRFGLRMQPPRIGQDTAAVLGSLGLPGSVLLELALQGVIRGEELPEHLAA